MAVVSSSVVASIAEGKLPSTASCKPGDIRITISIATLNIIDDRNGGL